MVLTDAELLELDAEIDRVNEALAVHAKKEKDCEIKVLNSLLEMSQNSIMNKEGEILEELNAEIRSIKEAKTVNEEHVKDLTRRLRNALAEKDASSSK